VRKVEIWADSFQEGDWACSGVASEATAAGGSHESRIDLGFVPNYRYRFSDGSDFELVVLGSYSSWSPLPKRIQELLRWGKPDLIAYDPEADRILFAVEETAAVPTGNQALQRCERQYGAARLGIPFWYLLSEFGRHLDGGVRRVSIWPTVMGLKLTQDKGVPSVVLHYSDLENPEAYSVGAGLSALFSTLLTMLRSYARGDEPLEGTGPLLEEQYRGMLAFVGSQWGRMLHFLPGVEAIADPALPANYAAAAAKDGNAEKIIWSSRFLRWPAVHDLPAGARELQVQRPLIKVDPFCERLEHDVGKGLAYGLSQNAGSRPQSLDSLESWLAQQRALFEAGPDLDPPAEFSPSIDEFPVSESGKRHVTTAGRVVFLYDSWSDVRAAVEDVYPRLAGRLVVDDGDERPALVYISNSVKPGRIFGDPFTGQLAAFAVAFGALDPVPRAVLAYYPHQAFPQAIRSASGRSSKGILIMRELADYLLFGGGVAVSMPDQTPL
jgi:hypothetical protein